MKSIWQTIKDWLKANASDVYEDLQPGVEPDVIAEAEREMGVSLPNDLRESLTICNGQRGAAAPLLGEWQLLSLTIIVRTWKMMHELWAGTPEAETEPPWWSEKWIPIAASGAGDFLCVDLSKKRSRQGAPIVEFWHTHEDRNVVADSFKELLQSFAEDLAASRYEVQDGEIVRTNS